MNRTAPLTVGERQISTTDRFNDVRKNGFTRGKTNDRRQTRRFKPINATPTLLRGVGAVPNNGVPKGRTAGRRNGM